MELDNVLKAVKMLIAELLCLFSVDCFLHYISNTE